MLAYDGEKTVFSSGAEEAVHVAGGQVTPLRPSGYRTVPTFRGILCLCVTQAETRLIRLDRKAQISTVVKDVDRAVLAENGKTVIYQQEGGLFSIPANAESTAKSVKLASGIRDGWLISRDKTALFYQDREGISWYLELGGEPVRVTDETVTKAFSAGSEQFVYQTDGRLFYTSGGKGSRVSGFSGEADFLETAFRLLEIDLTDSFWCLAGQEGSLYISTDGKDFARISPE